MEMILMKRQEECVRQRLDIHQNSCTLGSEVLRHHATEAVTKEEKEAVNSEPPARHVAGLLCDDIWDSCEE